MARLISVSGTFRSVLFAVYRASSFHYLLMSLCVRLRSRQDQFIAERSIILWKRLKNDRRRHHISLPCSIVRKKNCVLAVRAVGLTGSVWLKCGLCDLWANYGSLLVLTAVSHGFVWILWGKLVVRCLHSVATDTFIGQIQRGWRENPEIGFECTSIFFGH